MRVGGVMEVMEVGGASEGALEGALEGAYVQLYSFKESI